MNKRLVQLDADTGEILDGFVAYIPLRRKNGFTRGGWFAVSQAALDLLAKADLQGQDYKVLMKLLARLDFENLLVVNQAEVAKELGIRREHVNRSIKKLTSLGVLLEGPRAGIHRSYRLNPNFGWKGNSKNHVLTLEQTRTQSD